MFRRAARRTIRGTTRRFVRRTARRMMRRTFRMGGMVLLAAAGTTAAIKLTQNDAQRIQEHTDLPPEQLEDQDLQEAMDELNITPQPLSPEDQKTLGGQVNPSTPTSPPSSHPQEDYIAELERLADLRDRGVITNQDFETKKKQLLGL